MTFENPNPVEGFLMDIVHSVFTRPSYRKYIESFHLQGNEALLDFGCGGGGMSRIFAEILEKGKLTCLDTSPYWLTRAKKRLKRFSNVDFLLGDIKSHDLKNSSFDAINIHFVLHHVKKSERQSTVDHLADTLKKNGRIFIREPRKKNHGMPPEEIDNLMEAAGLRKLLGKKQKGFPAGETYFAIFEK